MKKKHLDSFELKKLVLLQDKLLTDAARNDFKTYINLIFKTKSHGKQIKTSFEFNWMNEIIIEELENFIISQDINNIMIFAPPRVGKSTISSMLLPSFLFGRFSQSLIKHGGPKFEVMSGSYNESLASTACREVQNYMDTAIYQSIFPQVRIPKMGGYSYGKRFKRSSLYFDVIGDITKNSLNSKFCFKNKADGSPPDIRDTASYRVVHPSASVTGYGYSLGILDDMVKSPKDVDSQIARDKLFDWYTSTFGTRQQKFNKLKAKTIILMTRWHHDDLPGRLLRMHQKKDKKWWRVVCLPAEGYAKKDPYRHEKDTRKRGEIRPIRGMDEEYFQNRRMEVGGFYNALFQQKPTSDQGEHIKRKWINFYDPKDVVDDNFHLVMGGADLSFDAVEGGSYNVFLRCGINWVKTGAITQPHVYVLDCVRERMDYADMKEALKIFIKKYENKWSGEFFIELAANAYAIKSELGPSHKKLKSRDAHEALESEIPFLRMMPVRDAKPIRVISNIGILKYGKLFVPKPENEDWVEPFVEELVGWPKVPNDDCVDALTVILSRVNKELRNIASLEMMTRM